MSAREDVLQAVRAWLKASAGLTDAQVVVAPFNDVRTSKDYLTVQILTHGVSQVEETTNQAGAVGVRSVQSDTVAIMGYGDTEAWIQAARLGLRLPSGLAATDLAGVSISTIGPVRDVSTVLDGSYEERYSIDVRVDYSVNSATEAGVLLNTVEAIFTGVGSPSDIIADIGKTGIA